ncbi:MAG: hypothetical protein LHV69_03370 [Elusimicrobia bacterium]|nr:hypothetical protein [Candidatus Obscuribacterium magneticum]
MVELVLGMWIFAFFIGALVASSRLYLLKIRLHSVARLGTTLQGLALVDEGVIQSEVNDYLSRQTRFPLVSADIVMGRFLGTPSSRFYQLTMTEVHGRYQDTFLKWLGLPEVAFSERTVVQKEGNP